MIKLLNGKQLTSIPSFINDTNNLPSKQKEYETKNLVKDLDSEDKLHIVKEVIKFRTKKIYQKNNYRNGKHFLSRKSNLNYLYCLRSDMKNNEIAKEWEASLYIIKDDKKWLNLAIKLFEIKHSMKFEDSHLLEIKDYTKTTDYLRLEISYSENKITMDEYYYLINKRKSKNSKWFAENREYRARYMREYYKKVK